MQTRMLGLYTYGIAGIKKPAIYKEFQILEDEHEIICFTILMQQRSKENSRNDIHLL